MINCCLLIAVVACAGLEQSSAIFAPHRIPSGFYCSLRFFAHGR